MKVTISKWEIAEMFGLEYKGQTEDKSMRWANFTISNKNIQVPSVYDGYVDVEQAKENVAGIFLRSIGNLIGN